MTGARETRGPGTRPKLGFVGLGWIGRHRMQAILQDGAAEVALLCDPSPEALAEAQAIAPDARAVPDFDALLDAAPDGIVIATPNAQHAGQSLAALDRGAAVFCQKPLGRTAAETAGVVAAAERADLLLGCDLSYRRTAAVEALRETVQAGELGTIFAIDLAFHNAYGPQSAWFYDAVQSGGGCLLDLGIHLVDLGLWLLDWPEPGRVDARLYAGGAAPEPGGVEDFALATVDLAGGAVLRIACSWRLHAGQPAVIGADIIGTGGAVSLHNPGGGFHDLAVSRHDGAHRRQLVEPPDDWGGRAAVDWARKLAAGHRFDPEARRFAAAAEVIDRIYAAGGRREALAEPERRSA